MIIHRCEQRSDEWRTLRAGKLTGSAAKDMLATVKSGEAAARRDLRYRLVAERLTGQPQEDTYINAAMQHGIDHESAAIAAYEVATGAMVESVGFVESETVAHCGTSPDGLVGTHGLISVKCPKTANHLRYIREGVEPKEHEAQNLHELWVTGRSWIDFVSYDPRLPEHLQLFIVRVEATPKLLPYITKATAFLEEVQNELQAVQTIRNLRGQLQASL